MTGIPLNKTIDKLITSRIGEIITSNTTAQTLSIASLSILAANYKYSHRQVFIEFVINEKQVKILDPKQQPAEKPFSNPVKNWMPK